MNISNRNVSRIFDNWKINHRKQNSSLMSCVCIEGKLKLSKQFLQEKKIYSFLESIYKTYETKLILMKQFANSF